jgi:hypothetical protein
MGRRRANATYFASHGVDLMLDLSYGMAISPLITDTGKDITEFVLEFIQRFTSEVKARLERLGKYDHPLPLPCYNFIKSQETQV